jgi:hypothetical protein
VNREQLEHVIRAAAAIANDEIIVVGSQAILAQHPDSPDELLTSLEADVYPLHKTDLSDEIDSNIGDSTQFARAYGYWAHGIGPETVTAPAGWEERRIRLELPVALPRNSTVVGWCMEIHDLVLSKLAARRPHDISYVEAVIRHGLVDIDRLQLGIGLLPESVDSDPGKNPRADAEEALNGILARLQRRGEI